MMLGIGAIRSTLAAAICITPFRAWHGGPLRCDPRFNDVPNHARRGMNASTTVSAFRKSSM